VPGQPPPSRRDDQPPAAESAPILLERPIPSGEAIAIHDFLTDGSFSALCSRLTELFGVEVTFRDRHGGLIESLPDRSPPWRIHEPTDADAPVARAIEEGASCRAMDIGSHRRVLPLRIANRPMGGLLVAPTPDRPFDELRLERVTAAAALLALTVVELCNREVSLRRRNAELDVLFRLSSIFVGAGDLDEVLRIALDSSRQILGVDAGTIHLLERDDREMAMHAAIGLSDQFLDWFNALDVPRAADHQALAGGVVVVENFDEYHDPRLREAAATEGLRSMLSVGLVFKNKTYGIMRLFTRQAVSFRLSQQMLARSLGEQISAAVAAARLEAQRRRDRQMRRHVRLAADVQRRMLSSEAPNFDALDISARYDSSLELGGDFYDLIDLDGWLGIVIGDVVGKGVPAALLMASVRSLFRAHATHAETVSEVTRRVNHTLTRDTLPGEFATAFAAWIDPQSRELWYSNAGHDPPLVIRVADPTSPVKLETGGPLLGVDAGFEYDHDSIVLQPGDTLIAYTDGVTDAMTFDGRKFGRERLIESVRTQLDEDPASTAKAVCDRIIWDIRRFVGLNTERDDITLIVLRAR
jgi:sigma-B regulation protein RsbU (phosphoserine phosphatase)